MGTTWKEYELNDTSIDEISEEIYTYLTEIGEETRNIQRNRLLVEELLLRIRDAYETPVTLKVMIGRHYGRHVIKLSYTGASFDPTGDDEDSNPILETIGLAPSWGYRKNVNTITMTLSGRAKRGRLFKILLSIALAALFGYLGGFLPDSVRDGINDTLLSPIISCFLGLLSTFAGIMIALTITSGVLGVGDSSTLSRIGRKVILRFLLITFLSSTVALLLAFPFFNIAMDSATQSASFQMKGITTMIFDIFPKNPIDPFLTGNSLQIIVIGLFVGVGLLALGERTKVVREFVQESASLSQWLTSSVCSLVPGFVFVALLHQIWSGNLSALLSVWRPLLTVIGVTSVWCIVMLLFTALRIKCSPLYILKAILPTCLIGLSTASSMTAFTSGMETCEKKLGVDNSYVKFAYPMGNVMHMQGTVMYLTIISLFFAELYGMEVSLMWFIMVVISTSLLAIAVPPIPGAGLMLFTILFAQLGIPEEALVMATAMDIVIDFADTGFNLYMLMLEIAGGANSMKRLDHDVLTQAKNAK